MHSITVPRASLSLMRNRFSILNFHSFAQLRTTFIFIKCSAPPTHFVVIGPIAPSNPKVLLFLILNLRALIDISICQTVNSICQNRIHFAATCLRRRRVSFEFQIFSFYYRAMCSHFAVYGHVGSMNAANCVILYRTKDKSSNDNENHRHFTTEQNTNRVGFVDAGVYSRAFNNWHRIKRNRIVVRANKV